MKNLLVLCLISTILLSSCGETVIEGEVYHKEFRTAHTTVIMLPLTISNGKTSTTMLMPYTVCYPDRYVIHIKAYQDEEWKTEDFYVSESVYAEIQVGDMFKYDKDRGDLQEEPYTKERK